MPKKYKYSKTFTYEGKRYRIYGDTLEEVYEKKANKLRDLKEGKIVVSGNMTVKEWSKKAVETYRSDIKDISRQDIEYRIEKFILPYIGQLPLKQVQQIDCMSVLSHTKGMSDSHISKIYQHLGFIFRTAKQNKCILENPMDGVVKPKGIVNSRRSITDEERACFLSLIDKFPQFIFFVLMLYCGCRPSESRNANYGDLCVIDGEKMFHIRGTKTDKSDRLVPMPEEIWDRLGANNKDAPLAPTAKGVRHTDSSYTRLTQRLYREMNIAMSVEVYRNALIPPLLLADDFVPYCFRHTFCTDLCRAGVDVRVAQRLMGHANISTTVDIYTHVDENELVKASTLLRNYRNANGQNLNF